MERKRKFIEGVTEILVKKKVLSLKEAKAIREAFNEFSGQQLDEFLLKEGLVDSYDLLQAIASYYEVPSFDVRGYFFDTFLLQKFPKGFLLRNRIIPLEVDGNMLIVIAANPNQEGLAASIEEYVSYDVQFRVGFGRNICDAVKEFYDKSPTEIEEDEDIRKELREKSEERREVARDDLALTDEEDMLGTTEDEEDVW